MRGRGGGVLDAVQMLERAPGAVRRFAYRIASGHGRVGRVVDRMRFRFDDADVPTPPPIATEPIRVVVGPANSAGQGFQWARAIERRSTDVHAVSVHGIGGSAFQPEVDLQIPAGVYQRSAVWHQRFQAFLSAQTHLIWESGLPLLGRERGSDASAEIRWATERGLRPALMFHGSDIRPPAAHAARNVWSPFRDRAGPVHALEATTSHNARLARELGVPVFVSTPDLLEWVPGSTWVPVVIAASAWSGRPTALRPGRVPVVVHAPTQRWLKGTDLIEPILRRLAADGVIDYRPLAGVTHAAMPEFYGTADIVLDQFRLGIYGVAACEALAAGRLVLSHVGSATREIVRTRTGLDLPVHETTVDTLESDLIRAATDPETFGDFRDAGPAFIQSVHDGRMSAAALGPYLGLTP